MFYTWNFLFFDRDEIHRNVFYTYNFLERKISLTSKHVLFKKQACNFDSIETLIQLSKWIKIRSSQIKSGSEKSRFSVTWGASRGLFLNTFYTSPIRGKSLWIEVKVGGPKNILGPSTFPWLTFTNYTMATFSDGDWTSEYIESMNKCCHPKFDQ